MKEYNFHLPMVGSTKVSVEANNIEEAMKKIRNEDMESEVVGWDTHVPMDKDSLKECLVSENNLDDEILEEDARKHFEFKVNVNGKGINHVTDKELISYQDLVKLAYGRYDRSIVYGVTYHFPKEIDKRAGNLTNNLEVELHNGMIFNVSR